MFHKVKFTYPLFSQNNFFKTYVMGCRKSAAALSERNTHQLYFRKGRSVRARSLFTVSPCNWGLIHRFERLSLLLLPWGSGSGYTSVNEVGSSSVPKACGWGGTMRAKSCFCVTANRYHVSQADVWAMSTSTMSMSQNNYLQIYSIRLIYSQMALQFSSFFFS